MTTEQKVSVLQKLRGRLIEQRERFMQYLGLLDQEQAAVERGDIERLQQQLDTEQLIVSEIDSFQRAIEPLEELYNRAYPRRELEIPPLRSALQSVQRQVREKVQRNARLLWPDGTAPALPAGDPLRSRERGKSVFADSGSPSVIDIST